MFDVAGRRAPELAEPPAAPGATRAQRLRPLPYADRPPASRHRIPAPRSRPSTARLEQSQGQPAAEPAQAARSGLKSAVDRTLATVGLLVLLPVLAFVALAVRVQSRGPAFYRQERVGLGGRTFRIWKFRTMTIDADDHLHHLLRRHGRHTAPLFKVPDDPRVTALGRHLRRYSVDELPQLINVVCGHMSLVGPRPQRPHEVALYTPDQHRRLAVRPG